MMSRSGTDRADHLLSATALREEMAEHVAEEMAAEEATAAAERALQRAFAKDFLKHHVGAEERKRILSLVENAALHGAYEVMIYSFPSDLCIDGGRAINDALPNWPETLQVKAREIHDLFERVGKPLGNKFRALVITFPKGMPGDVEFYVSWKPPLDLQAHTKD
jgi:hypothetical protein